MRHRQIENPTPIDFVVSENDAKLRLDQFLAKRLPEYSRSRLQQLIRTGFVRVNERATRPRQIVRIGDKIDLLQAPVSANTLWSMRYSATARCYQGSVEKSGPE